MTRKPYLGRKRPTPSALIDIVRELPAFSFIGFETTKEPPVATVSDLPLDQRSPAGGLFGFHAPKTWYAVGVTLSGTARHMDGPDPGGEVTDLGDVHTGLVVTRDAETSSFVSRGDTTDPPGSDERDADLEDAAPSGLVVDALHRVLGLPSPGEPPDPAEMIMSIWMDDVLTILRADHRITWAQMVRIHPAVATHTRGPSGIPPSDESIVEAITRSRAHIDWKRVHHRAVVSRESTAHLRPKEVGWMDPTMFARWSLSLLPDAPTAAVMLSGFGCDYEADRLLTLDEQVRRISIPVQGAA